MTALSSHWVDVPAELMIMWLDLEVFSTELSAASFFCDADKTNKKTSCTLLESSSLTDRRLCHWSGGMGSFVDCVSGIAGRRELCLSW